MSLPGYRNLTSRSAIIEYLTTIASKGQITIPKPVRDRLGLKTHDRIAFVIEEDDITQLRVPQSPTIASLAGIAGSLDRPIPWDEMRQIAREDHLAPKFGAYRDVPRNELVPT